MRWDFSKDLKDPEGIHTMTLSQVITVLLPMNRLHGNK